jgi:serine/threonine protein phosphatase PrpC
MLTTVYYHCCITALSFTLLHSLQADEDQFLVLACDGMWDVMSHEDAVKVLLCNTINTY